MAAGLSPAAEKAEAYKKRDITAARFGDPQRQALIKKAMMLQSIVGSKIIGQDRAAKTIQDRLVEYLEGFGTRKKDPIAVHLIGLPGIGKSSMADAIEEAGFTVERINVQQYIPENQGNGNYFQEFQNISYRHQNAPYVLLIDELDKLPEIVDGKERTVPFIGALNQILTDGSLDSKSGNVSGSFDFSNVMILTTMNFSPNEIEDFSTNALQSPKKYYDYTIEDFQKFNQWVEKDPSARYKLLSHLFRSNTVSRLAPNAVIMEALSADNYAKIVKLTVDSTLGKAMQGSNVAKRIQLSYTPEFLAFLNKTAVFAPSGARETIAKANALTEQLINFGIKAKGGESLDQPRKILLDVNPETGMAEITVTPLLTFRGKSSPQSSFKLQVAYDPGSRLFSQPPGVAMDAPQEAPSAIKPKGLTQKDILAARFPKTSDLTSGLADKIDEKLIGQENFTKLVEKEFNAYLNRPGPAKTQPPFLVFAGFPGIGKSELVNLTAANLGLPVARLNLQNFSADSQDAVNNFVQSLSNAINSARVEAQQKGNGKFIVLLEELDKVFEVDPQSGHTVNRPIMAIIKDLLNDGHIRPTIPTNYGNMVQEIDIRDAYSIITMNFGVDRFHFTADPRLTTIDDTIKAARQLNMSPAMLKEVLGSMFLPETVSRLMPRFHVMNPLNAADYKKLIDLQSAKVIDERLKDQKTGVNKSLVDIQLTSAYKKYLFSESVIPSEGARNTVITSQNRLSTLLEAALASLPKSSKLATQPLTLLFDFKPGKSMVVVTAIPREAQGNPVDPKKGKVIYEREVPLTFPPLGAKGRMPEERLATGVHEFGHAFTGVRLGLRFRYATVIPQSASVGGLVQWSESPNESAKSLVARIYAALGSRAMERIFMSEDPLNERSVLDITPGPSDDINKATKLLWSTLNEFGFDPDGGTMDRKGYTGMDRWANFADVPPQNAEQLGRVLRRMEDFLVADLLRAENQEWYKEKIARFARAGGMAENQFYVDIGYPFPGANTGFLGGESRVAKVFASEVQKLPSDVRRAMAFKQGATKTTTVQNMDAFMKAFSDIVKSELHAAPAAQSSEQPQPASASGQSQAR